MAVYLEMKSNLCGLEAKIFYFSNFEKHKAESLNQWVKHLSYTHSLDFF